MLIPMSNLVKRYGVRPKGILHIGANIGEEAEAYSAAGVQKVIWIEGNPELADRLKSNISKYPGHVSYNYCIGEHDGMTTNLHIANNGSQSSSILELGTHKQQHPDVHYTHDVPVTLRRIDKIFDELPGYDFINCDLQGAELMALRSMGSLLGQFKWAYIEVNRGEVYEKCAKIHEVEAYLKSFGFRRVATSWVGNWGDCFFSKR
jgi:FkbM family methyltransferase